MIKDVAVDCDKMQSNMSHKQKTDCTAGQRALCDHRTHGSTACTLRAGTHTTASLYLTVLAQ